LILPYASLTADSSAVDYHVGIQTLQLTPPEVRRASNAIIVGSLALLIAGLGTASAEARQVVFGLLF
jgi:hypothetical protein